MGKLGEVNGYVRMTLDKLEGIRGDGANRRRLAGMEIPTVARSIAQVDHKKPAKDRRERRKQGETAATQTIEAENVSSQTTRCKKKIVFLF